MIVFGGFVTPDTLLPELEREEAYARKNVTYWISGNSDRQFPKW